MDTGNTHHVCSGKTRLPVQPRGYGEHESITFKEYIAHGSAPWIRGTPKQLKQKTKQLRFSPVDTGNTKYSKKALSFITVQPRGYGEHSFQNRLKFFSAGSAPWIRGTLLILRFRRINIRFSPVDTGNTLPPQQRYIRLTVQPRGYGEHFYDNKNGF